MKPKVISSREEYISRAIEMLDGHCLENVPTSDHANNEGNTRGEILLEKIRLLLDKHSHLTDKTERTQKELAIWILLQKIILSD